MYRQSLSIARKIIGPRTGSHAYSYHAGLKDLIEGKKTVHSIFPTEIPDLYPAVIGTGSFSPRNKVDNKTVTSLYGLRQWDGKPISDDFAEKYFNIKERSLDIDDKGNAIGSNIDLATWSSFDAIQSSGIVDQEEIGCFIYVSPVPSFSHFQQDMAILKRTLGLSDDCILIHLNLGCGGLATAIQVAQATLLQMKNKRKVLITAAQSISSVIGSVKNARIKYIEAMTEETQWLWLLLLLFGDGAGSIVVEGSLHEGFTKTVNLSNPDIEILFKKFGGSMHHIVEGCDIRDDAIHTFPMAVKDNYTKTLLRVNELLKEEGEDIAYYLLHQSNGTLIKQLTDELQLADTTSTHPKFPSHMETLGNTSTPCTLMLLDELHKEGSLNPGDLLRFLWIGGGNGCQYGGSTLKWGLDKMM